MLLPAEPNIHTPTMGIEAAHAWPKPHGHIPGLQRSCCSAPWPRVRHHHWNHHLTASKAWCLLG